MSEIGAYIILVEDNLPFANILKKYVESRSRHRIEILSSGFRAIDRILGLQPGLVVLDAGLPDMDGFEVLRRVRSGYSGPIMMLTAYGEEERQVEALTLGADDYLTKPVSPGIILAHIEALLRRRVLDTEEAEQRGWRRRIRVGGLVIDSSRRTASLDGRDLTLTAYEFELLWTLADRAGHVVHRPELHMIVRGTPWDRAERSLDVYISRLRKKLGDSGRRPERILTVRSVGYMLALDL
ncbi:MAG: response regulator transcription factor [Deltaproteobacteria bacterium]|nr:response regulator transcription factor [Deltaproteobacteria bacterium]